MMLKEPRMLINPHSETFLVQVAGFLSEIGLSTDQKVCAEELEHSVAHSPFGFDSEIYASLTFRSNYLRISVDNEVFYLGQSPSGSSFLGSDRLPCLLAADLGSSECHKLLVSLRSLGNPIVLKNCINPLSIPCVRPISDHEFWHPSVPRDDQSYPEVTLICAKKSSISKHDSRVRLESLSERDVGFYSEDIKRIYSDWVSDWHARKLGNKSHFFHDFYDTLFHLLFNEKTLKLAVGVWVEDVFSGCFFAEYRNSAQIDMWGAVIDRSMIKFGRALQELKYWASTRGITYANLGGSETESLHMFKTSLGECLTHQRFLGIYE